MKAAIYTRVSTNDQVMRGESLDMQKERLVAYVKSQGWELYKIYEDGGFSGKDTNRPGFQQMLSGVELRKFDVVVVYKIDRLSRSILDFHKTMEFFNKSKISFVSITQQFDTTTSMGRLMLAILVDFANFEREIDVDRARDAYLSRLKNGLSSGRIPYGSMKIAEKVNLDNEHVKSILKNPFYTGYVCPRKDKHGHRVQDENTWHKGKHR